MDKMTYISIVGQRIPFRLLTGGELRSLWKAVIMNYNLYSFSFQKEIIKDEPRLRRIFDKNLVIKGTPAKASPEPLGSGWAVSNIMQTSVS